MVTKTKIVVTKPIQANIVRDHCSFLLTLINGKPSNGVWLVGCFSWLHFRGPNFCNREYHCFTWVLFYFFQKTVTKTTQHNLGLTRGRKICNHERIMYRLMCHHTVIALHFDNVFNIPVKCWWYWGMFVCSGGEGLLERCMYSNNIGARAVDRLVICFTPVCLLYAGQGNAQ